MNFNSTDAWLLQSIYHSQRKDAASLRDVIAYADYVNHAIMTYNEFSESISKLISVSLVTVDATGVRSNQVVERWRSKKFKGKKFVHALKEMVEIEKYLNETFKDAKAMREAVNVSKAQFDEAVKSYIGTDTQ